MNLILWHTDYEKLGKNLKENRVDNKRDVIVHAHIFKNAGTTIDWVLERNFGSDFSDNREDQRMIKEADYLSEVLHLSPNLRAISSHSMPLPIRAIENINLHTLVMFRHPLLRVKSVYEFEKKQNAQTLGAINAKNKSFREYVEWRMKPEVPPTIRNMHVRYLTRNSLPAAREELSEQYLVKACDFADSNELLGLVERFDDSILIFSSYFNSHNISLDFAYEKQNVNSNTNSSAEERLIDIQAQLGSGVYHDLLSQNKLDLELYDYVERLFERRLEQAIGNGQSCSRF